jgi:hypothetical protein
MDQYDDDAVLVRFDEVATGKPQIRQLMAAYLERSPKLQRLDAIAESDDSLSYQATMLIRDRTVRVRCVGPEGRQDLAPVRRDHQLKDSIMPSHCRL